MLLALAMTCEFQRDQSWASRNTSGSRSPHAVVIEGAASHSVVTKKTASCQGRAFMNAGARRGPPFVNMSAVKADIAYDSFALGQVKLDRRHRPPCRFLRSRYLGQRSAYQWPTRTGTNPVTSLAVAPCLPRSYSCRHLANWLWFRLCSRATRASDIGDASSVCATWRFYSSVRRGSLRNVRPIEATIARIDAHLTIDGHLSPQWQLSVKTVLPGCLPRVWGFWASRGVTSTQPPHLT